MLEVFAYIRTPCVQNQIKHVEIKYCSFTRLLKRIWKEQYPVSGRDGSKSPQFI